MRLASCLAALAAVVGVAVRGADTDDTKYNVLFLLVDDLKPALGSYDNELAITPHMDKLMRSGVQFDNMHSNKAECAPSRLSLLTGHRSDYLRTWGFLPTFRTRNPNLMTMPGHFREHGYRVEAVGKVFDTRSFVKSPSTKQKRLGITPAPVDLCRSSEERVCSFDLSIEKTAVIMDGDGVCQNNGTQFFPGWGGDVLKKRNFLTWAYDEEHAGSDLDACITTAAQERLQVLVQGEQPFFLLVGFSQPHLPWVFPKRILDLYENVTDSEFAPPEEQGLFWRDSKVSWSRHASQEMKTYRNWRRVSKPDRVKAYYAAVTHVDEQIGNLLGTLNETPDVADRTIVLLWGDHGFHLGEQNLWGKKTLFEHGTRIPFGIAPPRAYRDKHPVVVGSRVQTPTDSTDIFPTLVEMCNIPGPTVGKEFENLPRAGASLVPLLQDPTSWVRAAAVSQYESGKSRLFMGYSLRSHSYRLNIYVRERNPNKRTSLVAFRKRKVATSKLALFHYASSSDLEVRNLIDHPDHAEAKQALLKLFYATTTRNWDDSLLGVQPFDHPSLATTP
ncbi:Ulvan-active sulfatase (Arylsulfatase) (Polysaccharide utilization locus H protein P18) (PUL H protein P18) (Sulfatase family S1 subfamily 7 protein P18) (P18_S1_7) [Durusdinium trenchii]|uniref:Ulvan-active sulfatase (Arylsulfatase) (Polysaccharide utilization locus H protein P18) (PUL H protein P18) (Sulfatase family S1 subfamily 7 protein P18) (P18_S1_7) n=1 Tax=Durusdinium trenchii TaxID=1381693 RepID=A0ABP0KJS4_9DINO